MYVDARWYKMTRYGIYATVSSFVSVPVIAVAILLIIDIWNVGSASFARSVTAPLRPSLGQCLKVYRPTKSRHKFA